MQVGERVVEFTPDAHGTLPLPVIHRWRNPMPVYRVPVELDWPESGSPGANVWHVRTSVGGSTAGDELLQGAVDSIHTLYADLVAGGHAYGPPFASGLEIRMGNVVDVATQEMATPTFDALTVPNSGRTLPPANQVVVAWRTTIAARRGSGRTFFGPLNVGTQADDGSIDAVTRQNFLEHAQAFVDRNAQDNGWAVGIWGLDQPGTGPHGPKVLRDIKARTVGRSFAVLRSRRD
jgi:hypothetical protein